MACCGQKRASLVSQPNRSTTNRDNRASANIPAATVSIRYLRDSPVVVSGPVTGRQYIFSARTPIQSVDFRDAPSLLGASLFRQMF